VWWSISCYFMSCHQQRVLLGEGAVAWGEFIDASATKSNFGQLRVQTYGAYPDGDQMFAAGFLEGYITAGKFRNVGPIAPVTSLYLAYTPKIFPIWLTMQSACRSHL
jgi:hypothetical protein